MRIWTIFSKKRTFSIQKRLLQGFPVLLDHVHKCLDPGLVYRILKFTVVLEGGGTDGTVGIRQLTDDVVLIAAGVAQNGRMLYGLLHTGQHLSVGLGAGGQAGNAQSIGPVVELGGAGNVLNAPVSQVLGGFRNDCRASSRPWHRWPSYGGRSGLHWYSTDRNRRRRRR